MRLHFPGVVFRTRCSMIAVPVMPLAPVTRATFGILQGWYSESGYPGLCNPANTARTSADTFRRSSVEMRALELFRYLLSRD